MKAALKYVVFLWVFSLSWTAVSSVSISNENVLNIAHRGASAIYPEHTAKAYRQAIDDGADVIECDIVLTRDMVPLCRHESLLTYTTDVSSRPEFADRMVTMYIDDQETTGWFAADFTLQELKTLKAVQPLEFRDQTHNGLYDLVTLEEFIMIALDAGVGIYPELKSSAAHNALSIMPPGIRMEDIVLEVLNRYGYVDKDSNCFIQSFEEDSLVYIRNTLQSRLSLVMLIWVDISTEDLDRYVDNGISGVGCWKEQIARFYTDDNGYKNYISETTDFVSQCHERDLFVHVYTFRNEDRYLAWDFHQDPIAELEHFLDMEIEGLFTDSPGTLHKVLQARSTVPFPPSNVGNDRRLSVFVKFSIVVIITFIMLFI